MWRRPAAAGVILTLTVLILGGGPAAAATELILSPASGPPGTTFVITGSGFAPGALVKLHWGSQSGLELASGTGPDFTTTAVVPDAPPNSHPVFAVVTQGTAVSTSTASFQVTPVDSPPSTTTTTEVTTTTTAPAPAVPQPGGRAGGVNRDTSGVDGGLPDTTGGLGGGFDPPPSDPISPTATAQSPATTAVTVPRGSGGPPSAAPPAVATVNPGAGTGAALPPEVAAQLPVGAARASDAPDDGATGDAALGPRSTSQSAGAVSNPLLLFVGLGLVFGGGIFLAVRNRQHAG